MNFKQHTDERLAEMYEAYDQELEQLLNEKAELMARVHKINNTIEVVVYFQRKVREHQRARDKGWTEGPR